MRFGLNEAAGSSWREKLSALSTIASLPSKHSVSAMGLAFILPGGFLLLLVGLIAVLAVSRSRTTRALELSPAEKFRSPKPIR